MPVMAFSMNGSNAVTVRAEESGAEEDAESVTEENGTDQETGSGTEDGDGTVSGNDVPEPVCTCEKKCSV